MAFDVAQRASSFVLAGFFEDARVEEEDLSKLDVAVRHVSEHVLVIDEGLARSTS
jgi:hypothetical protein